MKLNINNISLYEDIDNSFKTKKINKQTSLKKKDNINKTKERKLKRKVKYTPY